jgi:hypothetical protein
MKGSKLIMMAGIVAAGTMLSSCATTSYKDRVSLAPAYTIEVQSKPNFFANIYEQFSSRLNVAAKETHMNLGLQIDLRKNRD